MQACLLNAPGKINLYLEITGDRPDGYHSVVMVLQSVELADRILLHPNPAGIRLTCDRADLPTDRQNLAYRAAALLQERTGHRGGVSIQIEKHIPVGAGMAGGSADAAAVLVGLNQIWQLGLTLQELQELAAELGSDVPFCVRGGTMLAIGRGEQLSPLQDLQQIPLLIAKPRELIVSTAWAYQRYREEGSSHDRRPMSRMLSAIAHQDVAQIGQSLYNDLETVVLPAHESVDQLKQTLQQTSPSQASPLGVMMSGSGPTVFAMMPTLQAAEVLRSQLSTSCPEVEFWVTQTSAAGISIEIDRIPTQLF